MEAVTRRGILAGASAALAGLAAPSAGRAQGAAQTPAPGLQLFTVRQAMAQDAAATLRAVAEIGYAEVEFAGDFGLTPGAIRALLDETGLRAPASHLNAAPTALADEPQRFIEAGLETGRAFLVLPWLNAEDRRTPDQYRALADTMNRFGEACRAAGLRFAYHNHDFEFAALDGAVPYDLLLQRCEPGLVEFELDLYWAVHAGRDPRALLAQYPGRFPLCHVKDRAPDGAMTDVGAGVIDFAAIFAAPNAAFEHAFVERDDAPDGLESARASLPGIVRALEA